MTTIHPVRCPRRLGTLLLAVSLAVLGAGALLVMPVLAAPAAAATPSATVPATVQPPAATPVATAQPPAGTAAVTTTAPQSLTVQVDGSLVNGTAGASATQPLSVTLFAFDRSALESTTPEPTGTFTGTAQSGRYSLSDVMVPDGGVLLAAVLYQGIYYRNYTVLEPGQIQATLPITIYESTSDPEGLYLQQMHIVIEPAGTTANGLEVVALMNGADRTFSGTIEMSLPAGAAGVEFPQTPGQFVATANGFSGDIVVRPEGGSQILATFQMAFDDNKVHVEQTLSLSAKSVIVISLNTVEVSGTGLQPMTIQDLSAEYHAYDAGALEKGARLAFDARLLPGAAATAAASAGGAATPSGAAAALPFLSSLPPWAPYVLGAALLLVVVGIAGWAWQRSHGAEEEEEEEEEYEEDEESEEPGEDGEAAGEEEPEEGEVEAPTREELLQAIADLDDAYEAGDMTAGEYKRRRAALKAQLAELGRG